MQKALILELQVLFWSNLHSWPAYIDRVAESASPLVARLSEPKTEKNSMPYSIFNLTKITPL